MYKRQAPAFLRTQVSVPALFSPRLAVGGEAAADGGHLAVAEDARAAYAQRAVLELRRVFQVHRQAEGLSLIHI